MQKQHERLNSSKLGRSCKKPQGGRLKLQVGCDRSPYPLGKAIAFISRWKGLLFGYSGTSLVPGYLGANWSLGSLGWPGV